MANVLLSEYRKGLREVGQKWDDGVCVRFEEDMVREVTWRGYG